MGKRTIPNRSHITVGEFLSHYPEQLSDIADYLRDLVRSTLPEVTEKAYTGWKLIGYRVPNGKRNIFFCCIVPQKKENDVLLGFEYGIAMLDPKKLLEGKGTQVRFVRLRQKENYSEEDLTWLIREAARVATEIMGVRRNE
jgi:hypothetical protein